MQIRWTKEQAAENFQVNPRTLSRRMVAAELIPGDDKKYSTPQICAAVFGDIDGEKLRLVKEQADKYALENAERRGLLVRVDVIAQAVNRAIAAAKAAIDSASNLEREDKDKIMQQLGRLWDDAFGVSSADKSDMEPTAPV